MYFLGYWASNLHIFRCLKLKFGYFRGFLKISNEHTYYFYIGSPPEKTVGLVDIHLMLKFPHLNIYLCAASELRET